MSVTTSAYYQYLSPEWNRPLRRVSEHTYSDGTSVYPCVEGILFMRPKAGLRKSVIAALDRGDQSKALRLLLMDQDRFSPNNPPDQAALDVLINNSELTLRDAMQLLNFGPVGNYFAHRWCTPTYLSGLALLQNTIRPERPIIEVACGIGHFLHSLNANGFRTIGIDIVFSKLWLAKRFLGVRSPLICADIEHAPPLRVNGPATVFCHDAYYFFEQQTQALQHMRAMARGGNVVLGHVHTERTEHRAGFPKPWRVYQQQATPEAFFVDDRQLTQHWLFDDKLTSTDQQTLDASEAIGWVEGIPNVAPYVLQPAERTLRSNPLLSNTEEQHFRINYPSEEFRREYEADMHYLTTATTTDHERYKNRQLLDLPLRW